MARYKDRLRRRLYRTLDDISIGFSALFIYGSFLTADYLPLNLTEYLFPAKIDETPFLSTSFKAANVGLALLAFILCIIHGIRAAWEQDQRDIQLSREDEKPMFNYFLLRGRLPLFREMLAAWTSLTVGTLLFAFIATRFAPAMGHDAALTVGLMLAVPVAAILLEAIRSGRLALPGLPERPTGRVRTQADRHDYLEKSRMHWRSLDLGEKEGLQYLTGFLGLDTILPDKPNRFELQQLHNRIMSQIDQRSPDSLPEEFIVHLGTEKRLTVLVTVDKTRRSVSYTISAKDAEAL